MKGVEIIEDGMTMFFWTALMVAVVVGVLVCY